MAWQERVRRAAGYLGLAAALVLIGACAGPGVRLSDTAILNRAGDRQARDCLALFTRFDRVAAAADVGDASANTIPGFPYLRVDRFLASFRESPMTAEQFRWWRSALAELDESGRRAELANLTAAEIRHIDPGGDAASLHERLKACRGQLQAHDSVQPDYQSMLRTAAVRPPAYQWAQRVLGLYPLTALAVLRGTYRLHEEAGRTFELEPSQLPVVGSRRYYGTGKAQMPPASEVVAAILRRSATNPFAIPLPEGSDRKRLFARFAPVWAIDTVDRNDRFGSPYWSGVETLAIDVDDPVIFQRISHVRAHDRFLLQLVYSIWFPARPKTDRLDLLGGQLDGITWRVTLDESGRPILYDAMHNCGCYHMFFPGEGLAPREREGVLEEPLWIPQAAPQSEEGTHVRIYIAPHTHYIQRVTLEPRPEQLIAYRTARADSLRALPHPRGRRSMFDRDGIVAGSERLERFILWPMGIPSPGAMRQWGTHATAFVGRRHFDDPDLLERYFSLPAP